MVGEGRRGRLKEMVEKEGQGKKDRNGDIGKETIEKEIVRKGKKGREG